MRNHEVTETHKLLKDGNLVEPGWSKQLLQEYNRADIRAPKFRIKEWDYYMIMAGEYAIALTISDDGYIGLQSASLLELNETPWEHTETVLNAFPMGKFKLPSDSSHGITAYNDKRLSMKFEVIEDKNSSGEVTSRHRHLTCQFDKFYQGKPFSCDITLYQPEMDTMVIATPWPKNHRFYYNQKINCMPAEGWAEFDGKRYTFNPEKDYGTLDWGRGVWTYDNMWHWGSGNGKVEGHDFGFNLGYGFGDTKAASENIIFYDGKAHKLDDVTFNIPEDSYTKPWTITSSDGRFEMDFLPVLDRAAKIDVKVIVTDQHQVFGKLSGTAVLDDGTVLEVKDLMCFFERVHNKY